MIYKEKQFSCYLYDQIDQENEALHPDNPRNFMDSLSPLISAMVSREAGTVLYEDLAGQFGSEYRPYDPVRCPATGGAACLPGHTRIP